MDPTPKYYSMMSYVDVTPALPSVEDISHLEGREHFPFFLTVHQIIMILHRYEGRQFICNGIIWSRP